MTTFRPAHQIILDLTDEVVRINEYYRKQMASLRKDMDLLGLELAIFRSLPETQEITIPTSHPLIISFRGQYEFLSNFYMGHPLTVDGVTVHSVEHYYQSAKASRPSDRKAILACKTPGQAKKAARTIPLAPNWPEIKLPVMIRGVLAKFTQDSIVRNELLDTAPATLIEGNHWHDNFWGDCTCQKCQGITGRNYLGRILMETRTHLEGV